MAVRASSEPGVKPEVQSFEVDEKSKIYVVLNGALKGAAHLANLLPTGSYSIFLILAPVLSDNGHCLDQPIRKLLLAALLVCCFTFCLASCFTDSFKTLNGTIYYGIVTLQGLWTPQLSKQIAMCPKYRLKVKDVVHTVLVLLVFATASLLNENVISCLFNGQISRLVASGVPPLVGFVVSVIFIFMPSERHGIGYPVVETEAVQAAADIASSLHTFAEDDDEAEKADKVHLDKVHPGGKSMAKVHPLAVGLSKSRKGTRES